MTLLLYYPQDWFFTPVFRPRFRLGIFSRLLSTTNPIVVVLTRVTMKDLSGHHCFYTYTQYFLGLRNRKLIINYIPFEHIYVAAVTRPFSARIKGGYARLSPARRS